MLVGDIVFWLWNITVDTSRLLETELPLFELHQFGHKADIR
jgi:hypothetical protein